VLDIYTNLGNANQEFINDKRFNSIEPGRNFHHLKAVLNIIHRSNKSYLDKVSASYLILRYLIKE